MKTSSLIRLSCVIFSAFLMLYALTCQRGVGWQDSGIFQYSALSGITVLPVDSCGGGLAVVHPTYRIAVHMFSRCFPEPLRVYAANLFSGAGMAVALGLLFCLLRRLTGDVKAAVAATVTLGLAQMPWWLATIAEVYTWSLMFLFAELLCLLNASEDKRARWWAALAFVNGVHLSVHNLALLNLPVYGVFFFRTYRREPLSAVCRRVATCAGMWLCGAAVLLRFFFKDVGVTHSVAVSLKSLLVGQNFGGKVMGTGGVSWRLAVMNWGLAGVSLMNPCWLFALLGFKRQDTARNTSFRMSGYRACLLALTVIHFLFWVRYFVPDQVTFVLPTLGLLAIWMGIGIASYGLRIANGKWWAVLAVGVVSSVGIPPMLVSAARAHVTRVRELPFRDEARYWLVPWKQNENSAQRFADTLRESLQEGDVLIGDLTAANPLVAESVLRPLRYRLVSGWTEEDESETVRVIDQALENKQRVFIVSPHRSYTIGAILEKYQFEREGVLWRVKAK